MKEKEHVFARQTFRKEGFCEKKRTEMTTSEETENKIGERPTRKRYKKYVSNHCL